jgi:hypothetical protein
VRGLSWLISDLGASRVLLVVTTFAPRLLKYESRHSALRCGHSHPLPACQRHSLLSHRSPPVRSAPAH